MISLNTDSRNTMMSIKGTTSKSPPRFVFMNPYAVFYVNEPAFKSYLADILNSDEWTVYDNDISVLPEFIAAGGHVNGKFDEDSLMTGISISQFMTSIKGGISINPVVVGLVQDGKKWTRVFDEIASDGLSISYLDVPYQFYKEFAKKDAVDEAEFNEQTNYLKSILQRCNKYVSRTLH